LLQSLIKFEADLTAQFYLKIFKQTTPLSKYLQTKSMHIVQAQQMVESTVIFFKREARNFKDILEAGEQFVLWANSEIEKHDDIYILVQNVFPTIRVRKRKNMDGENHNDDIPTTATDNFNFNVHNSAIDAVISKLEQRFSNDAEICSDFSCLDPRNFSKPIPIVALTKLSILLNLNVTILKDELQDFASQWNQLKLNLLEVYARYDTFEFEEIKNLHISYKETKCKATTQCSNCFICCFNVLFKYRLHVKAYNNLFIAYKYILTLSCTQEGCEKSFSSLTYIKNRLRIRLSIENLDAWMLMHYHLKTSLLK